MNHQEKMSNQDDGNKKFECGPIFPLFGQKDHSKYTHVCTYIQLSDETLKIINTVRNGS